MNTTTPPSNRRTPLANLTAIVLVLAAVYVMMVATIDTEAPVRAKVSRTRHDMRSLATGLEAYHIDHGVYPPARSVDFGPKDREKLQAAGAVDFASIDPTGFFGGRTDAATSPTYMSAAPSDPFAPVPSLSFGYYPTARGWILISPGPDGDYDLAAARDYHDDTDNPFPALLPYTYDPTNGTVSDGDLWRVHQ